MNYNEIVKTVENILIGYFHPTKREMRNENYYDGLMKFKLIPYKTKELALVGIYASASLVI